MTESSQQLIAAIQFAQSEFATWHQKGAISNAQLLTLTDQYDRWRESIDPQRDYSEALPSMANVSATDPVMKVLQRQLLFLQRELRRHEQQQRLTYRQAQLLSLEVDDRLKGMHHRGYSPAPSQVAPPKAPPSPAVPPNVAPPKAPPAPATPSDPSTSNRSLIAYLLDPRTLQALMLTGGGLIVLGLVIWLWSIGLFDNPLVMATCLGGATLAVLGAGMALVHWTRYQLAGRGLTLLGCLVLPLNLWFYDAQGLVTVSEGGHLWIPAVACCILYALVARVLKHPMFVYTLVAGVTMTGLLLLADQQVGRLWEVLAPSTLLVVLGTACVHAERLFTENDGPFSRKRFGKAFFQSGHVVLGAGLAMLIGGRLVGWLYEPWFAHYHWPINPDVTTAANVRWSALLLGMLSTYTYIYSQLVVDTRHRRYSISAVLGMLWCEIVFLDLLNIQWTESLVLLVIGSTSLAMYLLATALRREADELKHLRNALLTLGSMGTTVAVLWGAVALARAWFVPLDVPVTFVLTPVFGVAMLITAAACFIATRLTTRDNGASLRSWASDSLAIPLVALGATAFAMVGIEDASITMAFLMLIPALLLVMASRLKWEALSSTAMVATVLLLLFSVGVMMGGGLVTIEHQQLVLGLFYAEAAAVMGWAATRNPSRLTMGLAALSGTTAVWQLLAAVGLGEYAPVVSASVVGTTGLLVAAGLRASGRLGEKGKMLEPVSMVLIVLGSVSGLLMTVAHLLADKAAFSLIALAAAQAATLAVAAAATASRDLRRTLLVLIGVHAVAAVLVLDALSGLLWMERVELACLGLGILMLVVGHMRWRHEGEEHDPLVDMNLLFGSMLTVGPLLIGLLLQRFDGYDPHWTFAVLHEVGTLMFGLALLGAGVLCRVRSTTFAGGSAIVIYVLSLLGLVHLPELQSAAVYLMIGGGVFFGTAVLLSIYRDRILALPSKIRNGEGMFQVLKWR